MHAYWQYKNSISRNITFVAIAIFIGWIEFNSINWFILDRVASQWPSTQGIVMSHEPCAPVYECGLRYSYQVNGKGYIGRRISFTDAHLPKGWNEVEKKKWAASEFQNGQSVKVFYKPSSPELSALQIGVLENSYLRGPLILGVVMFSLLFVGLNGLKQSWTGKAISSNK